MIIFIFHKWIYTEVESQYQLEEWEPSPTSEFVANLYHMSKQLVFKKIINVDVKLKTECIFFMF